MGIISFAFAPPGWVAPRFLGGRICLDFANTLDPRLAGEIQVEAEDKLSSGYPALLAWAQARGLLDEEAATALAGLAQREAGTAKRIHGEALALRETLLGLFDALADRRPPEERLLEELDGRLQAGPAPTLVTDAGARPRTLPGRDLAEPLWLVMWSAAALLAEGEGASVGRCQAPGCGWVFLDSSRNRSRIWCSTEICGNRVRARRHAAASREARRRGEH